MLLGEYNKVLKMFGTIKNIRNSNVNKVSVCSGYILIKGPSYNDFFYLTMCTLSTMEQLDEQNCYPSLGLLTAVCDSGLRTVVSCTATESHRHRLPTER